MAALGGDFERRWAQTKESIEIMKKLWTEDEPEHKGSYSPDDLAAGRRELDRECERVGRDPATTTITVFSRSPNDWKVRDYAEAGADRIVFTVASTPDRDPFGRLEEIAQAKGL